MILVKVFVLQIYHNLHFRSSKKIIIVLKESSDKPISQKLMKRSNTRANFTKLSNVLDNINERHTLEYDKKYRKISFHNVLDNINERHTLEYDKKYRKISFHTFMNLIEKLFIDLSPLKHFLKILYNYKILPWMAIAI